MNKVPVSLSSHLLVEGNLFLSTGVPKKGMVIHKLMPIHCGVHSLHLGSSPCVTVWHELHVLFSSFRNGTQFRSGPKHACRGGSILPTCAIFPTWNGHGAIFGPLRRPTCIPGNVDFPMIISSLENYAKNNDKALSPHVPWSRSKWGTTWIENWKPRTYV